MKSFPLLTEAAQSGEITFDHVKAFARTVVPPRADEDRVALASSSEHKFLAKAKAYTSDDFAKLCRAWRLEADFHNPEAPKRIIDKLPPIQSHQRFFANRSPQRPGPTHLTRRLCVHLGLTVHGPSFPGDGHLFL